MFPILRNASASNCGCTCKKPDVTTARDLLTNPPGNLRIAVVMTECLKHFAAIGTALAVLFVSVNCTSAGCLLEKIVASRAARPCCCDHLPRGSQAPTGDHRCPTCESASARIVDNIPLHQAAFDFMPTFLIPIPAALTLPLQRSDTTSDLFTISRPPSLFGLHCALLV